MAKKRTVILKAKRGERVVIKVKRRGTVKLNLPETAVAYVEKIDLPTVVK